MNLKNVICIDVQAFIKEELTLCLKVDNHTKYR